MSHNKSPTPSDSSVRLDKWLWAARFYKTRSLATQAVDGGQVKLDGDRIKPARPVRIGSTLEFTLPDGLRVVVIKGLAEKRGSAPMAQLLYEETPESLAIREQRREAQHLAIEPSVTLNGRPTKQQRRQMDRFRG